MIEDFAKLREDVRSLEERFSGSSYDFKKIVHSEIQNNIQTFPQSQAISSLITALCVDTTDPQKQNRVRFFTPLLHDPTTTPVKALPWAYPISSMGGFDDSGLNWIPPASSVIGILFENGNRNAPYYVGTVWNRDRGPDGQHNWGYPIPEYSTIYEGHRLGYLQPPNDGSQVLPPWNTESYNGIDIDSVNAFDASPDSQKNTTYPNIYGFKTPQKHMLKMVDGNSQCQQKDKRLEILSGCGNWMLFKDDHLRKFVAPGSASDCTQQDPSASCQSNLDVQGGSQFFKDQNELRPWNGPNTPQNNKCELNQSGIQFLSISGHSFFMDDSVDEPTGIPNWERSAQDFDFGCNNIYNGLTAWVSATGHRIEMNDHETNSEVRDDKNYIRLLSAAGNKIELNDETTTGGTAGPSRGISMQSTSNHTFEMIDDQNEQASPTRASGGTPVSKAKNGFVKLRSGYGLEFTMQDDNSQQTTQQQYIQLFAPQTDNTTRGPHIIRMSEQNSGPGQIFIKAGGNYVCMTYDDHVTSVGDQNNNPSNWITIVSKDTIIQTNNIYINTADLHAFIANEIILLMAGKDCPEVGGGTGPCIYPVLVMGNNGVTISDRVFASASSAAPVASIFQMAPFVQQPST